MIGTFFAGAIVGMICYWCGFFTAAFFAAKGKDNDDD